MRLRLCFLLPLLIVAGCVPGAPEAARQSGTRLPVRLSADSIGPLSTSTLLGELRARYPEARDTLFSEHDALFPALLIPLGEVKAMAVQERMDYDQHQALPLDLDCPADFWIVSGPGGVLPRGGRTGWTWNELVPLYGPGRAGGELNLVRADFESLPGWRFDLDVDGAGLTAVQDSGVTAVPQDARIWRVFLPRRSDAPMCPAA